jgi:serine/threonine protein phosphatase PrpC
LRGVFSNLDIGRKRTVNEDYVVSDPALGFGVVADGVGGRSGGDRAARMATDAVHAVIREQRWVLDTARKGTITDEVAKLLRFALQRANQQIHDEAQKTPELQGMSTTCTFFLDLGKKGLVGHVGDSRAYLVRAHEVTRLTEDHVALLGGEGGERRALARALGVQREVIPDLSWVDLRPDDRVVLCTDGLSDLLTTDREIAEGLDAFGAAVAPDLLIDLANSRGGPDNIGVVVFDRAEGSADRAAWEEAKPQLDVLRGLGPLGSLSYLDLEQLRPHAQVESFDPGQEVELGEGRVAVLARGVADLRLAPELTQRVGPGAVVAETAMVKVRWPFQVTAAEELSLVTLPVTELDRLALERPRSFRPLWSSLLLAASERLALLGAAAKGAA